MMWLIITVAIVWGICCILTGITVMQGIFPNKKHSFLCLVWWGPIGLIIAMAQDERNYNEELEEIRSAPWRKEQPPYSQLVK